MLNYQRAAEASVSRSVKFPIRPFIVAACAESSSEAAADSSAVAEFVWTTLEI